MSFGVIDDMKLDMKENRNQPLSSCNELTI